MSNFAYVRDGRLVDVICAPQNFIDLITQNKLDRNPQDTGRWIQTSYNTRAGVHYGPDGLPDSGVALRVNFAGIGYNYDENLDAFYPPRPYDTWILNVDTCQWEPPVPYPEDDTMYRWDPTINNWAPWSYGE